MAENNNSPHLTDHTLFRTEHYNTRNVLYFDDNCDMQEATLETIVEEDTLLAKFNAQDRHILMAMYEILHKAN